MTDDETREYAARFGAVLPAEQISRMRVLAERVAAVGRGIPRMAEKWEEPAGVFVVPLRK